METVSEVEDMLSPQQVAKRQENQHQKIANRVIFGVRALYGLCEKGVSLPLNKTKSIDSGPVCITLDPESDPSSNVGIIDYNQKKLKVCYGIHAVFPGLYKLITQGKHDSSLLNPVRATATDECTLTSDMSGWRALGCLEFLPGSIWAGAEGG